MARPPRKPSDSSRSQAKETEIVTAGRQSLDHFGVVNPPVYHASTILYETADAVRNSMSQPVVYGRFGTPGTFALEDAMLALEGAEDGAVCKLVSSGLAAVTTACLAYTDAGGHLLVSDNVYEPTRSMAEGFLKRFGVAVDYFDPGIGAGIRDLVKDTTQAVIMEVPGSRTFDMTDVPAMVEALDGTGVTTMLDNTWASPYFFKPLRFGVHVSIQAATKFIVGHSDAMLGCITAVKDHAPRLNRTHAMLGQCAGPDDVYLTQRGLRTLAVRMDRHMENGLALARWLQSRGDVERVLYPALPDDPGHALWARDFTGASGVFGFALRSGSRAQADAFLEALELFGLGYSFGGYESLIVPTDVTSARTATQWRFGGPVFRIHTGLENVDDLIRDLEAGFEAFHKAG